MMSSENVDIMNTSTAGRVEDVVGRDGSVGGTMKTYKSLIRRVLTEEFNFAGGMDEFSANERDVVGSLMEELNQIFPDVKSPSEIVMDARVLKHLSRLCRQFAQNLSVVSSGNPNSRRFVAAEFADKLLNIDDQTSANWSKLGLRAAGVFRTPPSYQHIFGAVPWPPETDGDEATSQKATRRRATKEKGPEGPETQARVVDLSGSQESNEMAKTDVLVEQTYRQLIAKFQENQKQPLDYFRFVLDPDSFGRSVENMFYTSFLVKEGKAKISFRSLSGPSLPTVEPVKKKRHQELLDSLGGAAPTGGSSSGSQSEKHQVLMSITPAYWARLVKALEISEATISRSANPETSSGKRAKRS